MYSEVSRERFCFPALKAFLSPRDGTVGFLSGDACALFRARARAATAESDCDGDRAMSLRPNAPAFVPTTRMDSASSVPSATEAATEAASEDAVEEATAGKEEDEEEEEEGEGGGGGPSVDATTDGNEDDDDNDAVGVAHEKASETEELRERVKALEGELESARSKNERLSAAAAQAGRLSAALSNVDEDVKRLTNEVERKTEECEEAWALATEREAERDSVAGERDALAKRCELLKEECKAALKKAIATSEELKKLKEQCDALDEVQVSKNGELVATLTARVEELEVAVREAEEDRDRRVEEATSSAEARVNALESALEDEKASHADAKASLTAAMDALKSELADAKGKAERLRIELDEAVSATPPEPESTGGGISEEELVEAQNALEERENQLAATTSALEAFKKELEDVKDELRRSSDEKRALGAALNDAEAQVLESRKNVDLIVARAEQASKMFTSNASALRMAEARVATVELEVSVARDEAQSAEEQATSARDECARLKTEIESLERELADAKLRSSPLRVGASTDVIEALEAERRARALYQSDARYWRERFEAISAASASVMTPSAEPKRVVLTPLPPNRTPGTALRLAAGLEKSTKVTNPPASVERPPTTTTHSENNKSTPRASSIRLNAPDSDDSDDSEHVPISVDRQPLRQPSAEAKAKAVVDSPAPKPSFTATQAHTIAKTHDPIAVTRKLASYFQ